MDGVFLSEHLMKQFADFHCVGKSFPLCPIIQSTPQSLKQHMPSRPEPSQNLVSCYHEKNYVILQQFRVFLYCVIQKFQLPTEVNIIIISILSNSAFLLMLFSQHQYHQLLVDNNVYWPGPAFISFQLYCIQPVSSQTLLIWQFFRLIFLICYLISSCNLSYQDYNFSFQLFNRI